MCSCKSVTAKGLSHNREKCLTVSSCLSVRMYQRGSYGTNFRKILHWELELESVEKLPVWLKSDKISDTFPEDLSQFYRCRSHQLVTKVLLCSS